MNRAIPGRWRRMCALLALLLVGSMLFVRGASSEEPPAANGATAGAHQDASSEAGGWVYAPYRTLIAVRIDAAADWPAARRKELLEKIASQLKNSVGGVWQTEIIEAPKEFGWQKGDDIDRVTYDNIFPADSTRHAADLDKVVLVGVSSAEGATEIVARELDVRTQLWGPVFREKAPAGADAALLATRLIGHAFRPIARIEIMHENGDCVVSVRGGALPLPDRSHGLIPRGAALAPVIRHFDAAGNTVKSGVFPLPWTWLVVEKTDGAIAQCGSFSAYDNPLTTKLDGRTEYLALAASRPAKEMTLILTADGSNRPLADVEALQLGPGDKQFHPVGRTDNRGRVTISSPYTGICRVALRSGDELLAEVPLVPGQAPELSLAVPDNGRRAESGALVDGLQTELVDLVVQKSVLIERVRRNVAGGRMEQARRALAALQSLSTAAEFSQAAERRRAELKKIDDDKPAAAWLDAQLNDLRALAKKYLFDESIRTRSL